MRIRGLMLWFQLPVVQFAYGTEIWAWWKISMNFFTFLQKSLLLPLAHAHTCKCLLVPKWLFAHHIYMLWCVQMQCVFLQTENTLKYWIPNYVHSTEFHKQKQRTKVILFFNVLLTVHLSIYIYQYQPTWCTKFYNKFISSLYMFRAHVLETCRGLK